MVQENIMTHSDIKHIGKPKFLELNNVMLNYISFATLL